MIEPPAESPPSDSTEPSHGRYLDFMVEIGPRQGLSYPLVTQSPAGELRGTITLPLQPAELESVLKSLEIALLRSGRGRRQLLSPEEQVVQDFGQELFKTLFTGEVRDQFDHSLETARQLTVGLRLKLDIQAPELARLPWEFLYDPRKSEFLCLSLETPIVRYLQTSHPLEVLSVRPPLQILGMVANPTNLDPLDVQREKQRVETAVSSLQANGLVKLTWLAGATWRDLQKALRAGGPWHIFHFIGHGGFDPQADEGLIAFESDQQEANLLYATEIGRLLADHRSMRLVILNSCDGARGSARDVFSSTAAILVRRGLPAVLAMQYAITDRAAIEFSRSLYEALADGLPIDAAASEARKAVSLAVNNTIEWGTPVLYMRTPQGILFDQIKAILPTKPNPDQPLAAAAQNLKQQAHPQPTQTAAQPTVEKQPVHTIARPVPYPSSPLMHPQTVRSPWRLLRWLLLPASLFALTCLVLFGFFYGINSIGRWFGLSPEQWRMREALKNCPPAPPPENDPMIISSAYNSFYDNGEDGRMSSSGEWYFATCWRFEDKVTAQWWIENSEANLHILVRIPEADLAGYDIKGVSIDWFWEGGSDRFEMGYRNGAPWSGDLFGWDGTQWTLDNPPGINNVVATMSNSDGFFWFEGLKPLYTNDVRDWNWAPGAMFGNQVGQSLVLSYYRGGQGQPMEIFQRKVTLILGMSSQNVPVAKPTFTP